ncbi:MAG: tRNA 2-thiouridine(34) synthase MnmA [bacterium]
MNISWGSKGVKTLKTGKKKVFVGLSGGVDSGVSAYLLKDAGYDVTGVFIKVWQPENGDCTWKEDRRDAMRVAAHLGIKFMTLDLKNEYKRGVVDYMIDEYAKGRTPNPDVMCNREVKFGAFMNWALDNGADYVATGHYAQTENGEMFEGRDPEKDQSYFLWTLSEAQLDKILFPIGHLKKSEVRVLAEKSKLPVANKKDSQGVCFIGHIDMKDFIRENILADISTSTFSNEEPVTRLKVLKGLSDGDVLDIQGNIIGKHNGSLLYTIGERHGLVLNNHSANSPKYYVIEKDVEKNTITVAEKEQIKNEGAGTVDRLVFDDVHFISGNYKEMLIEHPIQCLARSRYRQKKEECVLTHVVDKVSGDDKYEVSFKNPQENITPGQSLVLYFTENKDSSRIGVKTLGGVII